MDPITAFATAGTVATFIEMGYHLTVNTYTIYNAASGMAKEDEQLGFYIDKLAKLSESMISTKPTIDLCNAEQGMVTIASKCLTLSNKLVDILNRSRTKKSHSIQDSAIAAFHHLVDKNEKEELKKELDECQRLFHIQLSYMISSDMIQSLTKLDDLAKSGQNIGNEIAALRQSILQLEKRVEKGVALTDIGEETANEFASLIKLSSDSLITIKSRQILEALSFSKLHQRYETVIKAHPETFDWIFQDNPDRSPKALREKMLFTNWLSSGDGIFYISGKPGSGKSTLMKFIYKNAKTRSLLDSWAAGRKVVLAKHFFWRPGEDTLEHSIVGLLQTLLHDVLEQCPELVPRVFPQQWIKIKDLPIHYGPGKIRIDRDDLYDAFDLFIDNCDLFETRCFFFMIDGLDEYRETTNEGYKELIKLLSSWATKIPGQLKLCVSSRELSVFLEHFSAVQGLRLQDLTADDIHKYVKERLESNSDFLDMEKPEDGINKLISEVTQKADGVFLWVALVVKVLDDACDEDSFQGLLQKINFLPPEVWDLFDELFNSIHESDRIESAQTFAVALKMLQNRHGMRLSLLRYSLLDDYHSNPIFASSLDSLDRILADWNDETIRRRIKRSRKQLYKRCKGLLEVVESDDDPLPQYKDGNISLKDTPLSQRISLIHRSVQEYLEEKKISEERAARTKNFDTVNAICQTYVAELTSVKRNQPDIFEGVYCPELLDIIHMFSEASQDAVPQESIIALQNLHKSRLRYISEGKSRIDFIQFYESNSLEFTFINNAFSVAHSAASSGWYEFFETWTDPCQSTLHRDIRNGSLALIAGYRSISWKTRFIHFKRYFLILRWLFEHGCSPNQAILNSHGDSVWSVFLTASFFYLKTHRFIMFEAVEIYLEYGANPDFSFIIKKGDKENLEEEIVKVIAPVAIGASSIDSSFLFIHESFDKDNELFKLISSRGGQATLRELFEDMRPPNVETILALIDRNLKAQQLDPQTPAYAEGTLLSLPPSEQETGIKELAEEPAGINKKPGSKPDDRDMELITAKQGDNMATLFMSLITNPLATFILGVFLSYCFLAIYDPRGS